LDQQRPRADAGKPGAAIASYVILTSKPGQFRTEADLKVVEAYDYLFCGRKRAQFVIAELEGEVKIRIVEESGAPVVNLVASKFLPRFATVDKARAEINQLAGKDATLVRL
jgi:hypothetical protein